MFVDPLDYLTAVERQILRHAIADDGRGIFASPLIGGSHDAVGRYLTEGGTLLPSHDWRTVWRCVVQLLEREPDLKALLESGAPTRADVAAARDLRNRTADAVLVGALAAFKAHDWDLALALVDMAELAAPLHRPSNRTYADMRGYVARERAAQAEPAGAK